MAKSLINSDMTETSLNNLNLNDKALEVLKKIYIAQHIREEGVLTSEFRKYSKEIDILKEHDLILEHKWYSHELLLTTEKGKDLASMLVKEKLKEFTDVNDFLRKHKIHIPETTLRFLIFDYFSRKLTFPVDIGDEMFIYDWREPIFRDPRIKILRNRILDVLVKENLCVKTFYYVATRGGELRELNYVICPEVQSFLVEGVPFKTGLDQEKKKIAKIYLLLKEIAYIINSDLDLDTIKEQYWNKLQQYDLTEEDIQQIIDQANKRNITSPYFGILSENKPFEIKNTTLYNIFLEKRLLKPLIDNILEVGKPIKILIKKEKMPIKVKAKEKLNIKELTELFVEIAGLEVKLRTLIRKELKKKYGEKWWDNIPSEVRKKCEKRKNMDIEDGWEPEKDLLNYADFMDYANIIIANWDVFKEYFRNNQAKLKTYLHDINSLGRRRVMHIRTVRKEYAIMIRQQIKWLSESIDKKFFSKTIP